MRAGDVRHDPPPGHVPGVVPAPERRHLPGAVVSEPAWNEGQRQAIERRGRVFVSAGAGTGKTAVLVERVVRRVQAGTPLDHLLVITFTERAAAELKGRVRARLREVGLADAAGSVDSAWISTIHGFCGRVLRAPRAGRGHRPDVPGRLRDGVADPPGRGVRPGAGAVRRGRRRRPLDLLAVYRSPRLRRLVERAARAAARASARRSSCGRSAAPTCRPRWPSWSGRRRRLGGDRGRAGGAGRGRGRRRSAAAARAEGRAAGAGAGRTSTGRRVDACCRRRWTSARTPTGC